MQPQGGAFTGKALVVPGPTDFAVQRCVKDGFLHG
jgi:hypothetical protein